MIKKTFSTLKENPLVFVVFFAATLLAGGALIALMYVMMPEIFKPDSYMQFDNTRFLLSYLKMMGSMLLFYLLYGFLIMPALGNYVYEMCSGKLSKGWYLRSLKRGWWKVVVLWLILIGVMIAFGTFMMIMTFLLSRVMVFLIPFYYVIIIALDIYLLLAFTAIMAEDSFSVALSNTFTVGSRYFFKLLGTAVLFALPLLVVSLVLFSIDLSSITIFSDSIDYSNLYTPIYWVLSIITSLYSLFYWVYLLAYSMNQYLEKRLPYMQRISERHAATLTDESLSTDSSSDPNNNNPV